MNSPWKGKAKATNQDHDDLRPIITYRHLLSNNLGVRDPLRVVALCDSDAFYAACERVRLELDPSVPIVVQQWESLIAVSYPAREFGISRMDKIKDAKKKCPNLLAVHVATYKEGEKEPGYWENVDTRTHKVSLDLYRRESNKIITMFKEALPTGEIEKASIDEAFIDFTRPVREKLLERYPYLAEAPTDVPNGMDSPLPPPPPIKWNDLGTALLPEGTDDAGKKSDIEVDGSATWHDVALSIAAELMRNIREDIHSKLGYTTSAGIARNKFLAKLCASYKKPNSQTILRNQAIPNYLHPIPFQKIRFLGGKLGDALAKEYDVSTVGDLLTVSLDEMQSKFGENALWVYELLRGIDRTEVKEKSALFKSMLASKNLPKPITQPSDGHQWIRVLAAELALRLNDARESMPTLWPKTIVLHARKGYESSRSKQATFPFVRNVTVDVIATAADKLWKELIGDTKTVNITSVQLAFTGLEKAEMGQKSIEGFFTTRDIQPSTSLKRSLEEDETLVSPENTELILSKSCDVEAVSFKCTRCCKTIALREGQATGGPNEVAQRLVTLQSEHNDFHFAQDLANSNDGLVPVPRSSSSKRKKVEPKGIAKFFVKK
ncbi:DNA/RNA polymerase [Suillus decipiens]|nr:DNA/RNA polymerase [Suillus decipiens]